MIKLDKTEFVDWLKSKEPTQLVYTMEHELPLGCTCPIATYLKETTGEVYMVQPWKAYPWKLKTEYGSTLVPGWAVAFIKEVDTYTRATVTASKALSILEEYDE